MASDSINKLFSSATGTTIAEVLTLPICTVKTVYQSNVNFNIRETIKHINSLHPSKKNNIKGFLQASTPAILSQILSTSTKYTFYEMMKKHRKTENNDIFNNIINGMTSGLLGSVITHPIDVWKVTKQNNKSFIELLKKSIKNNNLITNGLYRGYMGSFGKNIVLYSALFPLNDYYKSIFKSVWISAPLTSVTISFLIQPFDYYKVVVMSGSKPSQPFRGYSLMLLRAIPHFAITMFMTETIQKMNLI